MTHQNCRELEVTALPQPSAPPRSGRLLSEIARRLLYPFRRGRQPAPEPTMGFYTDTTVCIGCKACEVACKQWNQLPADGFHWTGNSYDHTGTLSAESWRHVKFVEQFPGGRGEGAGAAEVHDTRMSLPLVSPQTSLSPDPSPLTSAPGRWLMMSDVCKHCAAAPCQHACPTGAIIYNEFANVYIQPDICNGCAYCIAACPFGVITRSHFDGHAHKCTLCYDRQKDGLVPACAKACPTASIQFGPIEQLRERARQRVAELHKRGVSGAYLYGAEPTDAYSRLHSFYLLIDRPEIYGLPAVPVNPWLRMLGDYGRTVAAGLVAAGLFVGLLLWGS